MSLVPQLRALCRLEPVAPKVVFVSNPQIGKALERAVARAEGSVAGLTCETPRQYASRLARSAVLASDDDELLPGNRPFLAAAILGDREAEASLTDLPAPHRFARTVAASINTLRMGSIVPAAVRRRAGEEDASDTLRAVAACYERYVDLLGERGLYDEADVFMWAIQQVESGAVTAVPHTVYAVTDPVDLPECAYRFVDALRQSGRRFVRLGSAPGSAALDRAPALSAAAHFPGADHLGRDAPAPQDAPPAPGTPHRRFVRAVGAPNEVRAAVRDVIADASAGASNETADETADGASDAHGPGSGLDEAELAYTDSRPYLSLIVDTLDRLDVNATIATGLRGSMTRTGRALRDVYDWITEDFDPEILIRLLRSGGLRVDRWMEKKVAEDELDAGNSLRAHELASVLAERRYEDGRHGYKKALTRAIEEKTRDAETLQGRLEEGAYDDGEREALERAIDRTESKRRRLEVTCAFVTDLIALVTGEEPEEVPAADPAPPAASWSTTVTALAEGSRAFLEQFGPVDPPGEEVGEAERTLEERARVMFYKELKNVEELPVTYEAPGRTVASLMREWLDNQYVPPQRPRPGAVHVVPLESAGYSGRSRLYVVGGDSDTLSTTAVDDAMLRDADRRALSASLEGELPEQGAAADEALWRVTRALDRRHGPASFYTRIFDVESGEERFPSSLFLQLEADAAGAAYDVEQRTAGFLPDAPPAGVPDADASAGDATSAPLVLSDADAWLASYRARSADPVSADPASADTASGHTARERIAEVYPWIRHGEDARQARASERYTEHDGLLAPGTYPDLDFFAGEHAQKMSAGRLETLAETPYVYFLRYVLGVDPREEPALDDEPWMNRLKHGDILHRTFERFMTELDGAAPSPLDQEALRKILQDEVDTYASRYAPPSQVVREGAMRRLWKDALVFLRAEAERAGTYQALAHEVGFGFGPHRRKEGDYGDVTLAVDTGGDEQALRLRGRIDRVDRLTEGRGAGELAIWDYKTGSSRSYDDDEPLQDGATLQWALYAYALEALQDEPVAQSGYFFTSIGEMGARLVFPPAAYREKVDAILTDLATLARTGTFPMSPDAHRTNPWKYRGYARLFPNLRDRTRDLKAKSIPEDRPVPRGWEE